MLTNDEMKATKHELRENFKRLDYPLERVLGDLDISAEDLDNILNMKRPNPSYVWMLRDYLEDMLKREGIEMYPFSKLADHSANKWFHYETPWRER